MCAMDKVEIVVLTCSRNVFLLVPVLDVLFYGEDVQTRLFFFQLDFVDILRSSVVCGCNQEFST